MSTIKSTSLLGLLTSIMMATYIFTLQNSNQEIILSGLAIIVILAAIFLERSNPFDSSWNKNRGDLSGDITSTIVIFGILDSVLKSATPFLLLVLIANWVPGSINLPLWSQIILVGLLIELGSYISHRLHHKIGWLWSLHAMHHSPERMHTLNNFRFHPFNHIFNHIFMIVPVLLMGFSPEAILGYTALTLPLLLLQHSNIDFNFGWLNYVLNTNQVHRWHHSNASSEGNKNLGRALVIWDQIFGTFYLPKKKATPDFIGLFATSKSFPRAEKYLAQIFYPFSPQCCK
ncbi:MAG: sterol desaturase family protein [Devosiaceae bacterium]|nr:sterol desaturase family protein [Devosiaceae bacterium]